MSEQSALTEFLEDQVIVPLNALELALLRYGLRAWAQGFDGGAPDATALDNKLAAYWNRHEAMRNHRPSPALSRAADDTSGSSS